MSLKVVLADESSTIKKVFQLALQDFAVEVFSAHSGEDVVEICLKHSPNIIFIDTILQKKSGYKACSELKKNKQFSSTPIVLMWSSFVELDNDKFLACNADSHIEKPFDVKALRTLVKGLVPETSNQEISDFLHMPDIKVDQQKATALKAVDKNYTQQEVNPLDAFTSTIKVDELENKNNLDLFENFSKDDFEQVNLQVNLEASEKKEVDFFSDNESDDDTEPNWVTKTLSGAETDAKISPDLDETESDYKISDLEQKINTVVNQQIKLSHTKIGVQTPQIQINDIAAEQTSDTTDSPEPDTVITNDDLKLSDQQIEVAIGKIAKPIIEQAVWRIVPEVASQLVEKELKRLLTQQSNEIN